MAKRVVMAGVSGHAIDVQVTADVGYFLLATLRIGRSAVKSDAEMPIIEPLYLGVSNLAEASVPKSCDVAAAARLFDDHLGVVAAQKSSMVIQLSFVPGR